MSFRLSNKSIMNSRDVENPRSKKCKILFFSEGMETESIYLNCFKSKINTDKYIAKVVDRNKEYVGQSNQLKIIENAHEYLSNCKRLGVKRKSKIEKFIKRISEESFTIKEVQDFLAQNNFLFESKILSEEDSFINQLKSIQLCYEFNPEMDKIIFLIDRDAESFTKEQYNDVMEICKKNNYQLGISSPNFEFFLLLHLNKDLDFNEDELFTNENKLTYKLLKKECRNNYDYKFHKSKYDATFFINRFDNLLDNYKYFESDLEKLKTKVGTNLPYLLEELL